MKVIVLVRQLSPHASVAMGAFCDDDNDEEGNENYTANKKANDAQARFIREFPEFKAARFDRFVLEVK